MFRQLRFRLTLVNVVILFLLFVLLGIGTYYRARMDIYERGAFMINRLVEDVNAGVFTDPVSQKRPPLPPSVFFVQVNAGGIVTFVAPGRPIEADQLNKLVTAALTSAANNDIIPLGHTEYFFRKAPLQAPGSMLIVFDDIEPFNNMLHRLLMVLAIAALVSMLLSYLTSYSMARRAMIPIQEAWQQQKDFLSDASHELRTPLTVIQTNLEVVLQSPEETVESQKKWLDNISEEAGQMTGLINSLLFLARADANQQQLERELFKLECIVKRAANSFEPVAAARDISLHILGEKALPILGDSVKIQQVITILLDNAIRHSLPGSRVILKLAENGGQALVSVTDFGEGIAPEHLDKIFNRFYQADQARAKGGSGLGLSIAKWIVEYHGGTIQVTSIPRVQTTFTVQLPLNTT